MHSKRHIYHSSCDLISDFRQYQMNFSIPRHQKIIYRLYLKISRPYLTNFLWLTYFFFDRTLWVKLTFSEAPLSVNIVCLWPLMAIQNKLCIIRGPQNIATLDIGAFFHTLTRKLLFSLNTCTPCTYLLSKPMINRIFA